MPLDDDTSTIATLKAEIERLLKEKELIQSGFETRAERHLNSLTKAAQEKAVMKLTNNPKSSTKEAAKMLALGTPPPSPVKLDVTGSLPYGGKYALLERNEYFKKTSSAISANSGSTASKIQQKVLEYVTSILDSLKPSIWTPGFCSGNQWEKTTGGAAYSRWNTKYYKYGYTTMIPIFIDIRQHETEAIWNQRMKFASDLETSLHDNEALRLQYPGYEGKHGGSLPTFNSQTKFFVYLAVQYKQA
jgi:hypothetical protein